MSTDKKLEVYLEVSNKVSNDTLKRVIEGDLSPEDAGIAEEFEVVDATDFIECKSCGNYYFASSKCYSPSCQ